MSRLIRTYNSEPGAAARQAQALREEGISVVEDAIGDFHVDTVRHGWFPPRLPSDEGLDDESDDE